MWQDNPTKRAIDNYGKSAECERLLANYWQASDEFDEFIELIETDAELFAYFLERYGKEVE